MNDRQIKVGIFMGSKSDLPIVNEAAKILDYFGISNEINILSAHRSPHAVVKTLEQLEKQGAKLFIASAGMAAHLAGAIKANSILPVIGVPLDGGILTGLDSVLATMQMPKGVPVATMSVGKSGAINAAILCAEIFALHDEEIREKLYDFKKNGAKL
mgnify:CR=1 FL=1